MNIIKEVTVLGAFALLILAATASMAANSERARGKTKALNEGQDIATTMIMAKANYNSQDSSKLAQSAIDNTNAGECWKENFKDLKVRQKGESWWISKEEKTKYSEKGLLTYTTCYLGELNKFSALTKDSKELNLLVDEGKEMLVIFK